MTGVTIQSVLIRARDQFRKYAESHGRKALDNTERAERYGNSSNPELRMGANTYLDLARDAEAKAATNTKFADEIDAVLIQVRDTATTDNDRAVAKSIVFETINLPDSKILEGIATIIAKYRQDANVSDKALQQRVDSAVSMMEDALNEGAILRSAMESAINLLDIGHESGSAIAGDLRAALEHGGKVNQTTTIPFDTTKVWEALFEQAGGTMTTDANGDVHTTFVSPAAQKLMDEQAGDFIPVGETAPVKTVLEQFQAHHSGTFSVENGKLSFAADDSTANLVQGVLNARTLIGGKPLDGAELTAVAEEFEKILEENTVTLRLQHGIAQVVADVTEFHRTFAPDWLNDGTIRPLTLDEAEKRAKWIKSEAAELVRDTPTEVQIDEDQITGRGAIDLIDVMAKQIDAAMDAIYFAGGIPMRMGLDPAPFWNIVHGQNMAKVQPDGTVRRREGDGKVVKPEGWVDPHELIVAEIKRQIAARKA